MAFRFEGLQIWYQALELSVEVNDLAKTFPPFELYSLSNQMRRASDSVVLNIAEGSTGQSRLEFCRFLRYALRSGIEVVSCFFIAKAKGYLSDEVFQKFYAKYEHLCKMITNFQKSHQ
ncbi:MAG: four helix bundle protein [Chitinophagaceae bacterium]|nr:four helix bundle protein [Chitinophagaceae bacterium]